MSTHLSSLFLTQESLQHLQNFIMKNVDCIWINNIINLLENLLIDADNDSNTTNLFEKVNMPEFVYNLIKIETHKIKINNLLSLINLMSRSNIDLKVSFIIKTTKKLELIFDYLMDLLKRNLNYKYFSTEEANKMFTVCYNVFDIFKHFVQKTDSNIELIIDKEGKNLIKCIQSELESFISTGSLDKIDYTKVLIDFLSNLICVDDARCEVINLHIKTDALG